jgi:hypothetical protein
MWDAMAALPTLTEDTFFSQSFSCTVKAMYFGQHRNCRMAGRIRVCFPARMDVYTTMFRLALGLAKLHTEWISVMPYSKNTFQSIVYSVYLP